LQRRNNKSIKANDYKKIKKVIDDNADIIIKRWKEHFEKLRRNSYED